jgi:hypothetical protein
VAVEAILEFDMNDVGCMVNEYTTTREHFLVGGLSFGGEQSSLDRAYEVIN